MTTAVTTCSLKTTRAPWLTWLHLPPHPTPYRWAPSLGTLNPKRGGREQLVTNLRSLRFSSSVKPSTTLQKTLITGARQSSLLGQRGRHLQEKQGQRRIGFSQRHRSSSSRVPGQGGAEACSSKPTLSWGLWARMQRTEGQSIRSQSKDQARWTLGRSVLPGSGASRAPRGAGLRLQLGSKPHGTQGSRQPRTQKRWTHGVFIEQVTPPTHLGM